MGESTEFSPRDEQLRGNEMRTPDEVAAMLELKELGWGERWIAATVGCNRRTVRRYLAAQGVGRLSGAKAGEGAGRSGSFGWPIDFGEVRVGIGGERVRGHLFVATLESWPEIDSRSEFATEIVTHPASQGVVDDDL